MNPLIVPGSRKRLPLRRRSRTIAVVCIVTICLIASYLYLANNLTPKVPSRRLTDYELESRAVVEEILRSPSSRTRDSKVAFMFLTPGPLPLERLWHVFFEVWHSSSINFVVVSTCILVLILFFISNSFFHSSLLYYYEYNATADLLTVFKSSYPFD